MSKTFDEVIGEIRSILAVSDFKSFYSDNKELYLPTESEDWRAIELGRVVGQVTALNQRQQVLLYLMENPRFTSGEVSLGMVLLHAQNQQLLIKEEHFSFKTHRRALFEEKALSFDLGMDVELNLRGLTASGDWCAALSFRLSGTDENCTVGARAESREEVLEQALRKALRWSPQGSLSKLNARLQGGFPANLWGLPSAQAVRSIESWEDILCSKDPKMKVRHKGSLDVESLDNEILCIDGLIFTLFSDSFCETRWEGEALRILPDVKEGGLSKLKEYLLAVIEFQASRKEAPSISTQLRIAASL